MNALNELLQRRSELAEELKAVEADIAWHNSNLRARVAFSKKGETYEFHHEGRLVKAKGNAYGRYKVWEGKRIINSDCLDNLQTIRLNIALGRI